MKRRSGSTRSSGSSSTAARGACATARRARAPCAAGGRAAAVHRATRPTSTPSPPTSSRRSPATARSSARIKSLVRWNAMAMVVRANKHSDGIGGHISTFASAATLYEVGFNHFFRGPDARRRRRPGLLPGPRLARHLRPRLPRRPAHRASSWRTSAASWPPGGGLSSYPHPWLMPDFWQFPTVSMGLGPIMAIYQARFNRYLEHRGLKDTSSQQGLGVPRRRRDRRAGVARRHHARLAREARQPDLRHQLQPAAARRPGARQRQDHPGAGGRLPRRRLERHQGHLGQRLGPAAGRATRPACSSQRMGEVVDGEYQKYVVETAPTSASTSSASTPSCSSWSSTSPTSSCAKLQRGGHDPEKVYAAYKAAVEHQGPPTVILGQDDQGLRPGRGRRGHEHHPPAEEAQRETSCADVPQPLRHPDLRRRRRRRAVLQAGRRQPGDAVPARAPQGSWAATLPHAARRRARRSKAPGRRLFDGRSSRAAASTSRLDDDGLRRHARRSCCSDKELGK